MLITLSLMLVACKKKSDDVNFHYDYFPLKEGSFIEYKVTKIIHDDDATINHDTSVYMMKVVIGDTVIDNQGRIARQYFRYVYDSIYGEYKVKDLWTGIIDGERAELVEENERMIKLVFSPTVNKEWNKNAFNSQAATMLFYDKIHQPYTLNNLDFDSTVVVEEDSTEGNMIVYRRKFEVYAKGVGMIKKHYQDYTVENANIYEPLKGTEVFYEIVDYGHQ